MGLAYADDHVLSINAKHPLQSEAKCGMNAF